MANPRFKFDTRIPLPGDWRGSGQAFDSKDIIEKAVTLEDLGKLLSGWYNGWCPSIEEQVWENAGGYSSTFDTYGGHSSQVRLGTTAYSGVIGTTNWGAVSSGIHGGENQAGNVVGYTNLDKRWAVNANTSWSTTGMGDLLRPDQMQGAYGLKTIIDVARGNSSFPVGDVEISSFSSGNIDNSTNAGDAGYVGLDAVSGVTSIYDIDADGDSVDTTDVTRAYDLKAYYPTVPSTATNITTYNVNDNLIRGFNSMIKLLVPLISIKRYSPLVAPAWSCKGGTGIYVIHGTFNWLFNDAGNQNDDPTGALIIHQDPYLANQIVLSPGSFDSNPTGKPAAVSAPHGVFINTEHAIFQHRWANGAYYSQLSPNRTTRTAHDVLGSQDVANPTFASNELKYHQDERWCMPTGLVYTRNWGADEFYLSFGGAGAVGQLQHQPGVGMVELLFNGDVNTAATFTDLGDSYETGVNIARYYLRDGAPMQPDYVLIQHCSTAHATPEEYPMSSIVQLGGDRLGYATSGVYHHGSYNSQGYRTFIRRSDGFVDIDGYTRCTRIWGIWRSSPSWIWSYENNITRNAEVTNSGPKSLGTITSSTAVNVWVQHTYTIPSNVCGRTIRLLIGQYSGTSYQGDVQLDDIRIGNEFWNFEGSTSVAGWETTSGWGGLTRNYYANNTATNTWVDVSTTTTNYKWNRDAGGTGSSGTGSTIDHTLGTTSGFYLYIETSGTSNNKAWLRSPPVAIPVSGNNSISFWRSAYGANVANTEVYYIVVQ